MTIVNPDSIKSSFVADPDILWVPAEKHPEIAPKEFVKFIESYENTLPLRRAVSLCRRQSILSKSYAYESDENEVELTRTFSEKKRHFLKKMENKQRNPEEIIERDSFLPSIFKPKSERSLLRRSALSARGYSKESVYKKREVPKEQHKTINIIESNTSKNLKYDAQTWDKSSGVSLHDPPTSLTASIDLGSASLDIENDPRIDLTNKMNSTELRLVNINRSEDDKKRISWINGLLQDRLKSVRMMVNTTQGIVGLASFLTTRFKTEKTNIDYKSTKDGRLPLHVERNIYRMSHIKLADPNRDLHDQVLVYNFMYWYLSIQAPTTDSIYIKKKKRPSFISLSKKKF